MNILVDSAMPYWQAFFEDFAKSLAGAKDANACRVIPFKSPLIQSIHQTNSQISKETLEKVEILLVRSTTKVDFALLEYMPKLRFVGTATAGFDHLDTQLLNDKEITWVSAGGCNAQAVAQYVTSALLNLAEQDGFLLQDKTYAVVGHGNVGSRVANTLKAFACKVAVYDPPLQAKNKQTGVVFSTFEEILAADVICVHAPLNSDKNYPSLHLFNEQTLSNLTDQQYLINAGRGELIDNEALLALHNSETKKGPQVVLDVWENEPKIDKRLIPFTRYATQHIAGHTLEGKAVGTLMLYSSLCNHFNIPESIDLYSLLPEYSLNINSQLASAINDTSPMSDEQVQTLARELANCVYDIKNDDSVFRALMAQSTAVGNDFAQSRQKYPIRREFSALDLKCKNEKLANLLRALGFSIS